MSEEAASIRSRLASVRVGLRSELEVSRHLFRGAASYLVRDPVTFATHELSADDYQVFVALEDGHPLQSIFENLVMLVVNDVAQFIQDGNVCAKEIMVDAQAPADGLELPIRDVRVLFT